MASQRTDTSDIPSIGSIREFHVKDESESIAPNYLRLLLLERFLLTVTPRDPFSCYFAVSFGKRNKNRSNYSALLPSTFAADEILFRFLAKFYGSCLFSRKTRKKRTGRELPLGRAASYRVSFLFFSRFSTFVLSMAVNHLNAGYVACTVLTNIRTVFHLEKYRFR